MKLTAAEIAYVRSQGHYVTEKCDGCGKLLNQTIRFTITGKPEVYCSSSCRDSAFFGDRQEAKKHATPGKWTYCGGSLKGKNRGSIFCDGVCRKAYSRKTERMMTGKVVKSRTPTQSNQRVADAKTGQKGHPIADFG
jgi:hypothetical protein